MMRAANIKMRTRVNREKLLQTLEENKSRHAQIVQEAREGYLRKAQDALIKRIGQLRRGELVSLTFTLQPPADYTEIYTNAIEMLRWNQSETVELEADEFRQLVRDEWDWMDSFLFSNSAYSRAASSWLQEKSGGALVKPEE